MKVRISIREAKKRKRARIAGWVEEIRKLNGLRFLLLRDRSGYMQVKLRKGEVPADTFELVEQLKKESVVEVEGKMEKNPEAPHGVELVPSSMRILNLAASPLPLEFKISSGLSKRLDWRFLDLRNLRHAAIFKIQSKLCNAIRDFFIENGFIEVHTSKIVAQATESGANVFPIDYFGEKAYLAQSPQFYKQILMGAGFERVFEIAPVFRAEPHFTSRHICEYTSIDFEMSFIESERDVMEIVEKMLVHALKEVRKEAKEELKELGAKVRVEKGFPTLRMEEAKEVLKQMGKELAPDEDLDPEAERMICEWVKRKKGKSFVFVTNYPWKVRPFYIMKEGERETRSFDLLWNGLEITTGGQREHRYEKLVEQCKEKGLDPKQFEFFLSCFRYGMPPHGGSGTGLERLTICLLGLKNVREACLFPRDPRRVTP